MLRVGLMNYVENATTIEEVPGPEPATEDGLTTRIKVHASLSEAVEQTIVPFKGLKVPEAAGSDDVTGHA
jgi:hypothetical protein